MFEKYTLKRIKQSVIIIFLIFQNMILFANENKSSIDWQLVNPFNFFTDTKTYEVFQKIYDETDKSSENISLAFEQNLQKRFLNEIGINASSLGWASFFASQDYTNTCWDIKTMKYKNDSKCSNYLQLPKTYTIKVKVNTSNQKCSYSYQLNDNKINIRDKNCSEYISLEIQNNTNLTVTTDDNKILAEEKITVKDIVIAGLGDSYGSGEGNPDLPATFTNKINKDVWFVEDVYKPRKDNEVKWLDKRCHRSLYSYQFKTALEIALKNPKQSVSFVSFSCTGAKTEHLIDTRKKGPEKVDNIKPIFHSDRKYDQITHDVTTDRRYSVENQIKLLKETLKNREVDFLLLSIGGNDIGFASYVFNVVSKYGLGKKPNESTSDKLDKVLYKNYYRLNNVIKREKILKDNNTSRILLTAYPNVLHDENNITCKGDRRAFKIPFGVTYERKQRIIDTEEYLIKPLYKLQKNLANELKWGFIDSHRKAYLTHGFCAKNGNNANENFVTPHKYEKSDDWYPFNPKEYKAYAVKQRWIQLPVDSILMINLTKAFLFFEDLDIGFSDESSGIMHPTAEGLSTTASSNIYYISEKFPGYDIK